MARGNRELWLAALAVLLITLVYLLVVTIIQGIPAASGLFGHGIGILGFLLMLSTETLYTLRKRSRKASWGRMSSWLQVHIFTGVVGPYLVLLHASWKFNGLAGVLILLTGLIVLSGFIGRYIYTAVPRTVDGAEVETSELERRMRDAEAQLSQWAARQPETVRLIRERFSSAAAEGGAASSLVLGRLLIGWQFDAQLRALKTQLPRMAGPQLAQMESLLKQRRELQRQVDSLAAARRLLSLWHSIHIPIGAALFTAAFIHAGAAIYYATLLR